MNASDFVVLKDGMIVPVAAVRLALDLEARGCQLQIDGDGLMVGPRNLITEQDREAIRLWKSQLRVILDFARHGQETVQ